MISLVELREIDESNFMQCLNLQTSVPKESFVDSVVYSLAEAWLFYRDTKPFAIYESDRIIGFVSMYVGEENCQIINFLIDDAFQKRGYGTEAARICIRFLRDEYHAGRISVPVEADNRIAQNFWKKLGFRFSDTVEDGYIFMRLGMV